MTTLSSSGVQQHDPGESSVDGSLADYLQPLTGGAQGSSTGSTFNDVQQTLLNYIGQYPLAAVGVAVATGVMLGCLVKRR